MKAEEIVKVCKRLNLAPSQVLALYYRDNGKKYPLKLSSEEYDELVQRGMVQMNKVTKIGKKAIDDVLNNTKRKQKGIDIDEKYHEILQLMSTVLDISKLVDERTEERAKKFFEDDRILPFYFLWLYLFPSSDSKKNIGWEKLFGITYTGVPLRKVVDGNMRNFKSIAYSKDVGAYIIATYLYIRNHIRDGKCFIPKITTFFQDQEDYYINTKEKLDSMSYDEIIQLFSLTSTADHQVDYNMMPGMVQG